MSDGFHLADLLASPGEGQGGSLECGTQHRRQNAHARCLAQGNCAAIDGGWLWAEIVNETLDEHFHKRARDRGVGQDALVVTERSRRPIGRAWGIGGLREGSTCWVGRLFDQRGRSSRLRVLRPLLVHRLLAVGPLATRLRMAPPALPAEDWPTRALRPAASSGPRMFSSDCRSEPTAGCNGGLACWCHIRTRTACLEDNRHCMASLCHTSNPVSEQSGRVCCDSDTLTFRL